MRRGRGAERRFRGNHDLLRLGLIANTELAVPKLRHALAEALPAYMLPVTVAALRGATQEHHR